MAPLSLTLPHKGGGNVPFGWHALAPISRDSEAQRRRALRCAPSALAGEGGGEG
ncbi:hypothetical protein TM239_06190 [Bradyrhizobium sp. TM239]|nr:hypothetical protein TM233_50690 [Bradyrhizobium sp. TM233]GMO94625.1 hypothetical protein TM239_06190 [Bradyrhizobium sp. TM239]